MSAQDRTEPQESSEESPFFTDDEDRRHVRERLIFFSDAVIAIAMTLLALELPLPRGSSNAEVWDSFLGLLGDDYLNFVISFGVIAAFWLAHHQFFRKIHAVDPTLRRYNILWLFFIVILPFATRVNSSKATLVLGPVLYAAVITAIAVLLLLMARHATRAHLLRPHEPPHAMRGLVVAAGAAAGVFLGSIPLSFYSLSMGRYFWLFSIVIARVTRVLVERRGPTPA